MKEKKALHNIPQPKDNVMRYLYGGKKGKPEKPVADDSKTIRVKESNSLRVNESLSLPKYKTLHTFAALFSHDDINILSGLEKEIMANRREKRERITKNSILRSLVRVLPMIEFDKKEIPTEDVLLKRIKDAVGKGGIKNGVKIS